MMWKLQTAIVLPHATNRPVIYALCIRLVCNDITPKDVSGKPGCVSNLNRSATNMRGTIGG